MPQDYLLDVDDDLVIQGGDFAVAESTAQHQSLLLRLKKGELRQFPKTGVDFDNFLLDDNVGDAYGVIQQQFEADGMNVRNIEIVVSETNINKLEPKVEAYYNEE